VYVCVCVRACVCVTALFLSPRHDTNLRPVSLDSVWPEEVPTKKILIKIDQWRNQLKRLHHLCFFHGKNEMLFVFTFETQLIRMFSNYLNKFCILLLWLRHQCFFYWANLSISVLCLKSNYFAIFQIFSTKGRF
jgi:hypothetical protein